MNWKTCVATLGFGFFLTHTPAALGQQCGDVTDDGNVAASDALAVLKAAVGQDVELICSGSCEALEDRLQAVENKLEHVTVVGDNLRITGQNLQVVSGAGQTYSQPNGLGNVILGYNEADNDDDRTGSHNLVIGSFHSFTRSGGAVFGVNNEIRASAATVLGGTDHIATGDFAAILGGFRNEVSGDYATVAGGEDNQVDGLSGSIAGGAQNVVNGDLGTVGGGFQNQVNHEAATISGSSNKNTFGAGQWVGGGTFNGY